MRTSRRLLGGEGVRDCGRVGGSTNRGSSRRAQSALKPTMNSEPPSACTDCTGKGTSAKTASRKRLAFSAVARENTRPTMTRLTGQLRQARSQTKHRMIQVRRAASLAGAFSSALHPVERVPKVNESGHPFARRMPASDGASAGPHGRNPSRQSAPTLLRSPGSTARRCPNPRLRLHGGKLPTEQEPHFPQSNPSPAQNRKTVLTGSPPSGLRGCALSVWGAAWATGLPRAGFASTAGASWGRRSGRTRR